MRSGVVLVLVLGACGFRSNPAAEDGPPPPDAAPDVPDAPGILPDAAIDGGSSSSGFCDPRDKNLMVCYEFEGNTNDGSANRLDATSANVTFVPGQVGMAMQSSATSAANVPGSPVFDVSALTIEAWIQPTELPLPGTQSDIVDVANQYAFLINSDGTLTCDLRGGPNVSSTFTSRLTVGKWAHVACIYDGKTVSRIYIDGVLKASKTGNGNLATGGNPMAIAGNSPSGQQLIGLIDQLRLMKVVRSSKQICTDAGNPSCP